MAERAPNEVLKDVAVGTSVGAVVGGVVVASAFLVIGLSPIGPIAGGWFAANMGAGLVSGSGMAMLQSAAMTTGAYYTGAGVGGVIGGARGYFAAGDPAQPPAEEQLPLVENEEGNEGDDEVENEEHEN
eukprot:gene23666-26783_t